MGITQSMISAGEYIFDEKIGEDSHYLYYSGTIPKDNRHYIIKILKEEFKNSNEKFKLKNEFEFLSHMSTQENTFPHPQELISTSTIEGIVFQENYFIQLSQYLPSLKLSVEDFFPIAMGLCNLVDNIHKRGIVDSYLNMDRLFFLVDTKKIKFFDYTYKSELNNFYIGNIPLQEIKGDARYLSPEQTGRTNRFVTQYSDLYSLGIILYELLTGELPFLHKDPIKQLLAHISTEPTPPHRLDENIPEFLSNIVMKLLEKLPENRYASTKGLLLDLQQAKEEHNAHRFINFSPVNTTIISSQLNITGKLYGRKAEEKILLDTFTIVKKHACNAIIISGESGIGKTHLVNELLPKINMEQEVFVSGKFTNQQAVNPYDGLYKAINNIIETIQYLPEEKKEVLSKDIVEEMGPLIPVITEFLPNITKFVGKYDPLPMVGIEETKNRFELSIMRLLRIFGEHFNLIMNLDDIHFADASMFSLLTKILYFSELKNILFLLTYEAENLSPDDKIFNFLNEFKLSTNIIHMDLKCLNTTDISEMCQDILSLSREDAFALASIIGKKTGGNPYFLKTLLEELFEKNILFFAPEKACWKYDLSYIEAMPTIGNVTHYIQNRIESLPLEVKSILHLASCIGNKFSLDDLALFKLFETQAIINGIEEAAKKDIVIPLNRNKKLYLPEEIFATEKYEYIFHHEDIRIACHKLQDNKITMQIHLKWARILYDLHKHSLEKAMLLTIVNHYNIASVLVDSRDEIRLLCHLNHQASEISLQTAAYEAAFSYDEHAVNLIEKGNFLDEDYTFSFEVYFNFIKSSFLCKKLDISYSVSEKVLGFSKTNFDKARIYALKGNLERAMSLEKTYVKHFEEGLRLLDHGAIAIKPNLFQVLISVIRFKILFLSPQSPLKELSAERNPEQELIYTLVERIAEEAYFEQDIMRYVYLVTTWASSTYSQHNRELRSAFYSVNGILWPRNPAGYRYCVEAYNYTSYAPINEICTVTTFVINVLNFGWHIPWKNIVSNAKRCCDQLERVGNFELYAYSLIAVYYYDMSSPCDSHSKQFEELTALTKSMSPRAWTASMSHWQFYRNMAGQTNFDTWEDDIFSEKNISDICTEQKYKTPLTFLYYNKLRFSAHADNILTKEKERNSLIEQLNQIIQRNNAFDAIVTIFFCFLFDVKQYRSANFLKKITLRFNLSKSRRTLISWAKNSENLKPYILIMKAETANLKNSKKEALNLYQEAINAAKANENIELMALALHHLGLLQTQMGQTQEARTSLKEAIKIYEDWHAFGIAKHLKEQYKDML